MQHEMGDWLVYQKLGRKAPDPARAPPRQCCHLRYPPIHRSV